ncbi:3'(2'),5'-bisphosphate nucleotidase CysQ [Ascidiaceihabitans sp.]|uniref:inositol monophosphatase family protein n=1 Tax=Ascidiaceihabitans sp. TaxID=1872644 RepID=UPI003297598F
MQDHDLDLLIDACRIAGRIATSYAGKTAKRWDKPEDAGPVTEADLAVNDMFHAVLRQARPDYGWLSEETEDSTARQDCDTVFIVDPIDGTRSFAAGDPTWAHSVAVAHEGHVTAAVVYLPLRDKLYAARKGGGATLNGTHMRVSSQKTLHKSSVLTTRPAMKDSNWKNGAPDVDFNYRPSLAYRMACIAEGRFDVMFTFRPTWEWDIAAGELIIAEAGGAISDRTGRPLTFNNPTPQLNGVIAGTPLVHRDTLDALHPA